MILLINICKSCKLKFYEITANIAYIESVFLNLVLIYGSPPQFLQFGGTPNCNLQVNNSQARKLVATL